MGKKLTFEAEHDIPILMEDCIKLGILAQRIIQAIKKVYSEDHFGFMIYCFVGKQIEHLRSVIILTEKNMGRDAELIARSMVEGMGIIKWTSEDKNSRSLIWRSYALIEDYRLIRQEESLGNFVAPELKERTLRRLEEYGPQFYNKQAKEAIVKGKKLPDDPYRRKWIDKRVDEIFTEIGNPKLYKQIYQETSQWIHWTPKGLAIILDGDDTIVSYTLPSKGSAATALAVGFEAVYKCLILMNTHFDLGFEKELEDLIEVEE